MTTNKLAVATDTRLAELHQEAAKLEQNLARHAATVRSLAGQKQERYSSASGNRQWSGTLNDALATDPATLDAWQQRPFVETVDAYGALLVDLARVEGKIKRLNALWVAEGRWSRFFLVQNNNGHIHSNMNCSTTYPTTQWAWLPGLSGLTEVEAVADQGEILCSICFPSAPVAWTQGTSKVSQDAKAVRAAEKAARDAKKSAKLLFPDGSSLTARKGWTEEQANTWSEKISTIAAAKAWLTDSFDPYRGGYVKWDRGLVAEVLAERTGETVADLLAAAKVRAEKRAKRDG